MAQGLREAQKLQGTTEGGRNGGQVEYKCAPVGKRAIIDGNICHSVPWAIEKCEGTHAFEMLGTGIVPSEQSRQRQT